MVSCSIHCVPIEILASFQSPPFIPRSIQICLMQKPLHCDKKSVINRGSVCKGTMS